MRLTEKLAIEWSLVYAVLLPKYEQEPHRPISEAWVFCDLPWVAVGEPFVKTKDFDAANFVWRLANDGKFKVIDGIAYDATKVVAVSESEDRESGSITFRFSETRTASVAIPGLFAHRILLALGS